jgi:DtxR family transcriptional regulator, Mn-dependent transcriptional regulator
VEPEYELSESLEDYLIAIADLAGAEGCASEAGVHSVRVASRVGVSTASVTHAFRALRERGLIDYKPYQAVRLTPHGAEVARRVMERKRTLLRFFREVLELDQEEAERNAHRMEHVITAAAVDRLSKLVDRVDRGSSATRGRPAPTGR